MTAPGTPGVAPRRTPPARARPGRARPGAAPGTPGARRGRYNQLFYRVGAEHTHNNERPEEQHLRRGQLQEVQRLHRASEVRAAHRDAGPFRSGAPASHALSSSCPPGRRTVPRPGRGLARQDHEQYQASVRVYNADVDGYGNKEEPEVRAGVDMYNGQSWEGTTRCGHLQALMY